MDNGATVAFQSERLVLDRVSGCDDAYVAVRKEISVICWVRCNGDKAAF